MGGRIIEDEAEGIILIEGYEIAWVDRVCHAATVSRSRVFTFPAHMGGFYDTTRVTIGDDGSIHISIEGENILGDCSFNPNLMEFLLDQRKAMMQK